MFYVRKSSKRVLSAGYELVSFSTKQSRKKRKLERQRKRKARK